MNIFYLDSRPDVAARAMCDKHVVKMILETAQLLSTAHRILDGKEQTIVSPISKRRKKIWVLPDERNEILYSATHVNHPCAKWTRETNNNYNWLYCHFMTLLVEYTYRYGKQHKCEELKALLSNPPHNIEIGYLKPLPLAMPDEYKIPNDPVGSYRNYYKYAKAHLLKYTRRDRPHWLKENVNGTANL